MVRDKRLTDNSQRIFPEILFLADSLCSAGLHLQEYARVEGSVSVFTP